MANEIIAVAFAVIFILFLVYLFKIIKETFSILIKIAFAIMMAILLLVLYNYL